MAWFGSDVDHLLQRTIQAWKQIAADEIDDIGGWRDAAEERADYDDPARGWHELPDRFYIDTTYLSGYLTTNHPKLDPTPLHEIYAAVAAWHEDHSPARLPPQPVLRSKLEQAMLVLNSVDMTIQSRLRHAEPVALTERQELILETMLAMGVTTRDLRQTQQVIVRNINPSHDPANYKHDFARLRKNGYTDSTKGSDGGVWLTKRGIQVAREKGTPPPH